MNEARKKGIILVIIGAILATLLVGLFVYNDVMPMIEKNKESNKIIEAFYKKYNAKERNIIYYAKDDCSYCKLQTPILDEIAEEYDLKYYYINSNKLTKKDIKKITNELDIKNETPITIIVEDGEVVDTQVGYLDGSAYTEFLKKNSENLKQGTIEIAQESEKAIVDVETLKKTNSDIIETLDALIQIHDEGTKKRSAAEIELQKIEKELKDKLVKIRNEQNTQAN